MPGRLAVSYRVRSLPGRAATVQSTLDQMTTDQLVDATGTITAVRHLQGSALGRTMIVLTDDDGNSAHVLFTADVMPQVHPVIYRGSRITVHGLVSRTASNLPAGIEGFGVRVVTV